MSEYVRGMTDRLIDEFKKCVARTLFLGVSVVLIFVFTPMYEKVVAIWEIPERLDRMETQITELGGGRIIRQVPGMSYVKEPVYKGANVTLIIVAERTSLGKDCTLTTSQSLFTDENRIATPGDRPKYSRRRNIPDSPTTLSVELIPPHNLKPGRVEVYLILEYDCNGTAHFDKTDVLTFQLLDPNKKG